MGHPAQYSRKKQGDSTNKVYGSKLEKKESTRNSVEAKKQTTVIPQIVSAEFILVHSTYRCRNYSREETIQSRKLLICYFFKNS